MSEIPLGFDISAPYIINGKATNSRKLGEHLANHLNRGTFWILMCSANDLEDAVRICAKLHQKTECFRDEQFPSKWNFCGLRNDELAIMFLIIEKSLLSSETLGEVAGTTPNDTQDVISFMNPDRPLEAIQALHELDDLTKPYRMDYWSRRN